MKVVLLSLLILVGSIHSTFAQVAVALAPDFIQHFMTNSNTACVGCKLFVYQAGTTTKATIYTTSSGTVPNTNPIIMNSRGEPQAGAPNGSIGIWLPTGVYKIVLSPAADTDPPTNPIWTLDNVTTVAASGSATAPCSNILTFGGVGNGATDNTTAWNAALAAASAKPCIYFPAGDYTFSSQVSYTLSANNQVITIFGDGPDTTILRWPAGGGIKINGIANETAFHVHDLSLLTSAANAGVGFDAEWGLQHNNNMASSTFDRMRISGDPVEGGNFWAIGIKLNGISQININSLDIYGQGGLDPTQGDDLYLLAPGTNASFIYNIINSNFFGALNGLHYGGSVQGVAIANVNFTLNHYGIYVGPDTGGAQAELSVVNSQFDNQGDNVLVDIGSNFSHGMFSNNIFYIQPATSGIHIKTSGDWQIRGNNFGPTAPFGLNGSTGVLVEAGEGGSNIIDGNNCINMAPCIHLTSTSNAWRVSNMHSDKFPGSILIQNDATSNDNTITGFTQQAHETFPNALAVTAAASAGGLIQVTTTQSTDELVVGQIVMLTAPGLSNQPALYKIGSIPDSFNVILAGSAYGGSLIANGALSILP